MEYTLYSDSGDEWAFDSLQEAIDRAEKLMKNNTDSVIEDSRGRVVWRSTACF